MENNWGNENKRRKMSKEEVETTERVGKKKIDI